MIQFNPLQDKYPKGAVSSSQGILFEVWVHQDFYFKQISLNLFNDFTQQKFIYTLEPTDVLKEQSRKYIVNVPALETGLYFYDFEITFEDSTGYLKKHEFNAVFTMEEQSYSSWQLTVYDADFQTPEWMKGSIMYQIFPDRFKKSPHYQATVAANEEMRVRHDDWNAIPYSSITHEDYRAQDFFMGNLKGIHEELPYFKQLKIDSIYLNPIVESPENHRYSTSDYFNVDPYLGTVQDFKDLCKDFKEENIRITLDGVFSHTGADSIYFNRYGHYDSVGAYQSQDSPYYPWFTFMEFPNVYQSWWGFTNLPTVVKENKEYQEFMFNAKNGVIPYWQRLGIGGWRIDVADEFPDCFIDQLRKSAKQEDPDCFLLGEVWEDATTKFSYNTRRRYFLGKQFDSVMNYPWRDAIIRFVKHKDARQFSLALLELLENYPKPALDVLMNLLSSHDTERILTILAFERPEEFPVEKRPDYKLTASEYQLAKERFFVASFIQFTLPGVPCIYYGDEIGMYGFRDPYNRMPFKFNEKDDEVLAFYQKLTNFRHQHQEDFKTDCDIIKVTDGCIAYKRGKLLCIINLDDSAHFLANYSGDSLYQKGEFYPTPHGIVVGPNSFGAIELA